MKKLNIGTLITAIENNDNDAIDKFKKSVEVIHYLPTNKKIEMEDEAKSLIISNSDDGTYFISPTMKSVVMDLLILKYLTNIEPSNKDNNMITANEYDYIMSEGIVLRSVLMNIRSGNHVNFIRTLDNEINNECVRLNSFGVVISNKIDKIVDQLNPKEWNKVVKTISREFKKAKDNGSLDRMEDMVKNIGIDKYVGEIIRSKKIESARDKIKK
jgi:hypothetical protein